MTALLALLPAAQPAHAACARDLRHPVGADRAAYAAAVQAAAGKPTAASAIGTVMASGPWRIVWAEPAESEPGVFVFRRRTPRAPLRYLAVWGGALGPDGPQVVADWARKTTHMPAALAACVGDRVAREGP